MICLILEWTVFEQSWFWRMWDPKCIKNQRPRSSWQSSSIVQHHSAMLCLRFELCIDVDGAATDFPVGGSNFEVYVSPVTAGAPRCPSGAQVFPGHQDPEYRSTHQLIDLSSFEALSGNTLQQLANEKLTASWQISLGFHDFHGKAHTINCFLYWIWNDMDYIWILLPVSCSPVFQVECAACTLDTAIYLGTTCAASSATAVLTATTTLGARMTGGRGSRDFTKIQNSFQQYLTLFDFWILLACVQCVQFHL